MQRRALLRKVAAGRRSKEDVYDAHPDLVRAGVNIGTAAVDPCPVCASDQLVHVSYVFEGKGGRSQGGRAVPRESLARQAERHGDLTVYTVEVCPSCSWHHLVEAFVLQARGSAVG